VVVAVTLVGAMEATLDQVIDVISVRYGLVPTRLAMIVRRVAPHRRRVASRMRRVNSDRVFVDVIVVRVV
jgi:hypothetical protein